MTINTEPPVNKMAVFSFYNTPSGLFKWWDEFPREITTKLNAQNIDHICFYRNYTSNSSYSINEQNPIKPNSFSWLMKINKLASQYDNVIFHTHSYYPPLKLYLLTLLSSKRLWIITEHRLGETATPAWKRWTRQLLRQLKLSPKYVICVSDAVASRNTQLYGSNIKRIHNGINLQAINTPIIYREPKNALYVGRLDPKKGIWNLVLAFDILVNTLKRSDLKLNVVGGGNILNELKAFVIKQQLDENITFHGYQTNPQPNYMQADFVVIPTIIKEACPLVSLEARNFGLPLLYANRGGLPETVGKSGRALIGLTPDSIAESIMEFTKDKNSYNRMLSEPKEGLNYFSMDRMTNEYVDFYQSLLN
jgi:glycosyltransferase involved in cell wall biosynthesis